MIKRILIYFGFVCDAYNETPAWDQERDAVVADIANAAPVDDDKEWFQVAPYGEHPNRVGLQLFTKSAAEKVVASFNSVAGKIGRFFRGLPIYAGHPDVDPGRWPDSRRLGKITELQAREDGLYAKAVWNALGAENNEQGYYVFPSPRWWVDRVGKGVVPKELISVGLTNTPNIRTSAPVTANDEQAAPEPNQNEAKDGTADAINAAVAPLVAARDAALEQVTDLTAERDSLQTKLTAANDALTAERGLRRDALLDHAVESGRITLSDRPALVALFNADWTKAENDLKARQPAYNTKPIDLPKDRTPMATEQERHAARMEAVNALMQAKGVSYDTAWEMAKKAAKTKHLWAEATNA